MRLPWWRIAAGVVALSILGTFAIGRWIGTHLPTGQYAGMEVFYEGFLCSMLAAIADGLAVLLAMGMSPTLEQPPGRSLVMWLFGGVVGIVTGVLAFGLHFFVFHLGIG